MDRITISCRGVAMPRKEPAEDFHLCRCVEVRVMCRFCGPLLARINVNYPLTPSRLREYQRFVLQVHKEAMHHVE